MTATATPRRAMRDRVQIGQAWQRNRDKQIGVIRQIHRPDRQVQIMGVTGVSLVSFTDLRTKWTEVDPTVGVNPPTQPAAQAHHATVHGPASAAGNHFHTSKPNTTIACRRHHQPGQECPACHNTGRQLARDFERNTGNTDIPALNHQGEPMQLPTSKTSRAGLDPRDARVLLVGPPKVGKTTLAAAWAPDHTLILDTHQGSRLLDGEHYVQPIETFKDFEDTIDTLAKGGHQFRTVVIDLIEQVYKMADRQAGQQFKQVAAGLVEYGKGTSYAEAVFTQAVDKLLATPLGVWFIGHTETVQDGNIVQYVPKIDKRVRTYIEGACDFCLLAEAHGPKRQIHTAPSAKYQAGSRVSLPEPLPLDARRLYVEMHKGLLAKPATDTKPADPAPATPTTTSPEPIAA